MPKSAKPKQSSICSRTRNGRPYFYCWIAGKQHGLGFDREAADRKYAELLLSKPQSEPVAPSWPEQISSQDSETEPPPVMVAHVLREFLVWVKKNRSGGTYDFYAKPLTGSDKKSKSAVPFLDFIGDMPVSEFGEQCVKDWIDTHYSHGSDTYRHNLIRAVKCAFKWACSKKSGKLLSENPIDELELPSADSREVDLTDAQWAVIEAKVPQPLLNLLIVLKETGARPLEIRLVEAKHLQANNGRPRLYSAKPFKKTRGKEKPRKIYLTERALAICQEHADKYPTGPLFRNEDGKPWSKNAINNHFTKKRREKIGIMFPFFPYSLRHKFCTDKLKQGIPPATVAELLGNSVEMVMRVYNQLGLDDQHVYDALTA